ncbi:MAG: AI-2E family transporter [Nanoarchaeota archaeon]|nr:AI-2E family transporter [Nanoarchaeota archaeon]MBU1028321.1 AI-2E family transporter [Nanoarchaeota archaeon]
MKENSFKKALVMGILLVLLVLSFFLLKPILIPMIVAFILAFIFNPVYNMFYKIFKSKNISASLICLILLFLIILPIWFLTPIVIDQSFKIYLAAQQMDFVTPLKGIFPSLFASEQFSAEIGSILHSFFTKTTNSLVNELSQIIFNFPTLLLQFSVVFFTFFFVLRDKDKVIDYIKTLLPFSKDVETKMFESSKGITTSLIYGQIIVGIIQGIIVGVGLFIFSVPNSLFLTLLAILGGILPIIGTTLVWVPVVIYLFIAGNTFSAIGVLLFGIFSSTIDNVIRPLIVSKRTNIHPVVVLIGMIGGLFLFGVLGFILGPLILSYLLILLDTYRKNQAPSLFIEQKKN